MDENNSESVDRRKPDCSENRDDSINEKQDSLQYWLCLWSDGKICVFRKPISACFFCDAENRGKG